MPEYMPESMPEQMPERMPERMSQYMAEQMSNRMSECIAYKFPDDVSCVRAGIARSKVILMLFETVYDDVHQFSHPNKRQNN